MRPTVDQRSVNLIRDDPGVVACRDVDDRAQLVVAVGGAQLSTGDPQQIEKRHVGGHR